MRLRRLGARSVRNLAEFEIDTDAQFLVIHGQNAQGKTNFLEAIYAVATLKPLRGRGLRSLVSWQDEKAAISATVLADGLESTCRLEFDRSTRALSIDSKKTNDLSRYFENIRAIAFCPHYGSIITEEPRLRRAWIDRAAFTSLPSHLEVVQQFQRCLSQKSALLRGDVVDATLLSTLNVQLAKLGVALTDRRLAILESLLPHIEAMHTELSGGLDKVDFTYRTSVLGNTSAEREQNLFDQLEERSGDEIRRGMTLIGPHKDDITISIDGRRVRTYGSRGQVRSIVLAMKLAEMSAAQQRGVVPIFLLDDLSSELDRNRTTRLVRILRDLDAQVVITTTAPEHLEGLPKGDTKMLLVEQGHLRA
jgi:DNA replication and repair protein RecF